MEEYLDYMATFFMNPNIVKEYGCAVGDPPAPDINPELDEALANIFMCNYLLYPGVDNGFGFIPDSDTDPSGEIFPESFLDFLADFNETWGQGLNQEEENYIGQWFYGHTGMTGEELGCPLPPSAPTPPEIDWCSIEGVPISPWNGGINWTNGYTFWLNSEGSSSNPQPFFDLFPPEVGEYWLNYAEAWNSNEDVYNISYFLNHYFGTVADGLIYIYCDV
jgi:hypothetical protein